MMTSCDSFLLLLNQISVDFYDYMTSVKNILAVVGAWYTLRFTINLGCSLLSCLNDLRKVLQRKNFIKNYGPWAVITGCTSGIGSAFASELASNGLNIVLVARNVDLLQEKAKYLETIYGVNTMVVVHDFNEKSISLMKDITALLNQLDIGILINNVGIHYDYPMEFSDVEVERVDALVQVNIASTVAMTRLVLPGMKSRKRGLIVNISSSAAQMSFPLISLYSSSKKFMDHFSQCLYEEVRDHNVHVQSLTPSYISTRMTEFSPSLQRLGVFSPTPETYVKHAIRTLGHFKVNAGYYPHTIQIAMLQLMPHYMAMLQSVWFHRRLNKEGILKQKDE